MSFSDVFSFDTNYRRDSFSHRVCDDLSEVILQFLPIENKFRFECVSKQFQRTVFQKQYELNVDDIYPLIYDYHCFSQESDSEEDYNNLYEND